MFAIELAAAGNNVIAIERTEQEGVKSADFMVGGVRTELKVLSPSDSTNPDKLSGSLSQAVKRGRNQASEIVIDARSQPGMTREVAEWGIIQSLGADESGKSAGFPLSSRTALSASAGDRAWPYPHRPWKNSNVD